MHILSKIFSNLGMLWNKVPKDFGALTIRKGNGRHSMVTISTQQIIFHSAPYRSYMPISQSILLDGYTLAELVVAINNLGYASNVTSEVYARRYQGHKAYVLMPAENILINTNTTFSVFSSHLWQFLYPFARILEELDTDTSDAISQIYADSANGKWTDYWATFFNLTREINESDPVFQKRVFLALLNVKTTRIAIQELLKHTTNSTGTVEDAGPAQILVTADPDYMGTSDEIRRIVKSVKGAGIDYLLSFRRLEEDLYKAYYKDRNLRDFSEDGNVEVTHNREEVPYGFYASANTPFIIGSHILGQDSVRLLPESLVSLEYFLRDISETTAVHSFEETTSKLLHTTNPFIIGVSTLNSSTDALANYENFASIYNGQAEINLSENIPAILDAPCVALGYVESAYSDRAELVTTQSGETTITASDYFGFTPLNTFTLGTSLLNSENDPLFHIERGSTVVTMSFTRDGVPVQTETLPDRY